jgi:hypothetical protein
LRRSRAKAGLDALRRSFKVGGPRSPARAEGGVMPSFGTRGISRERQLHPPGGSLNHSFNSDQGMEKLVQGVSLVFGSGAVTGPNGTFSAAWQIGDTAEVIGSNLNSGFWTVTAVDAANNSFLNLDGAPKPETVTCTLRTP